MTVSSCIHDSLLAQSSEELAAAPSSSEVTPKKASQSEPTECNDLLEEGINLLKEGSVDDLFKEGSGNDLLKKSTVNELPKSDSRKPFNCARSCLT
jgi:hypothetical protein